jgi:NADPH2:quinone reductase
MQALLFDGPAADTSRTRVGAVPVPTPGPGEVLIRVTHAGINFKDVMMRRGDPGYVPAWPVIPGLEVAGEIVGVGDHVRDLVAGTRVAALTNTGGLAEYVVAREALTVRMPDGVPPEIAAVVPGVWSTAWLLLHEAARVRPGDTILVYSASGAVGTAIATPPATFTNTTLLGVVGSVSRVDEAKLAGYPQVFVRDEHFVDAIRSSAGDRGVDIVLDPQGTTWLDADLRVLAPAGRIVLFGNASGAPLDPVATARLYAANGAVGGFSIAGLSATAPALVQRAIEAVFALIIDRGIAPRITVAKGLSQAAALQQNLADGTAKAKHVIQLTA